MKLTQKIASVFSLLLVYGVSLSLAHFNNYQPASTQDKFPADSYVASLSIDHVSHSLEAKHSISVPSSISHLSGKKDGKSFTIIHRTQSIFIKNCVKQLRYVLLDILVEQRKADLLYPFHYFW